MIGDLFPEVDSTEQLDDVLTDHYVECSKCVDMVAVEDGLDPVQWAKDHRRLRPWHTTFRTRRCTRFSVPEAPSRGRPDQPSDAPATSPPRRPSEE
ncbi:hypothetical protein SAMN04487983_1021115 [Streptomyces sp. yr375]|nr:hypothetical protein SAMN04487983_1021115 [Streptomyces sp. yr375]